MLFYVTLYAVTLLLIIASQYVKKRWKAPIFSLLLVVASIVILCFVAAARDVSIGTDTKFYPLETFNGAKNNDLSEFMAIPVVGHEYLYYLIVYVCSTVFNSFSLLLFITELLCVAPVFFVLSKESSRIKSSKPIIIGAIIYLLFSYNLSLNMMRQSIAMAFCLVALYYYYYGKKKKAFIWIVFGCLFQTYTIIAIPIILLYKACKRVSKSSNFKIFKALLFLSMLTASMCLLPIVRFISTIFPNLVGSAFMDDFANVKNFSLAEFLFWTAISAISFICKKGVVKDKNLDRFFDAILIVSPFTAVLNYFIHFSGRIILYLQYILLFVAIPIILSRMARKKQILYSGAYLILFVSYWYFFYVMLNINETVPYVMGGLT